MHLSLRLAFARTDCTPMTHCVPRGETVETSGLFALISFLVQLDGGQYRTRTCDPMHVKSHPFVFFCILIIICTYFRWRNSVFMGIYLLRPSRFCPVWVTVWVRWRTDSIFCPQIGFYRRQKRLCRLHLLGGVRLGNDEKIVVITALTDIGKLGDQPR